jgi:hypothetical protein
MRTKSVLAVLALTATSVVLAVPAPHDRNQDCENGWDWEKKVCKPPPMHCPNGYDPKANKCCDYGYDEHVSTLLSAALGILRSLPSLSADSNKGAFLQAET